MSGVITKLLNVITFVFTFILMCTHVNMADENRQSSIIQKHFYL